MQQQQFAVPVARRTPEWGWLEYLLMVSCATSKLRLRAGWAVLNKRLLVENEQRCRGLLTLHAWFPVSDLPNNTSVQDTCQNGFRASSSGIPFHIGNIRLPGMFKNFQESGDRGHNVKSRGRSLPQGRRLYEFLLCKVGVGRSFLIEDAEAAQTLELPPEYESFFVRHDVAESQPVDLDSEGVLPHHVMHHEYIIRDPSQALPLYLVHFEYDPEEPERLALPICDNCGIKAALRYCEADAAQLCENCDTRIHAVNTIAQKHIRMPINERPGAPMGSCPDHPDEEADEYCVVCKTPICKHCRSLGSHGAGEALHHKRLKIFDAYRKSLKDDARSGEAATLAGRAEVEAKLSELDGKLAQVQRSGTALEDKAYDIVQQAVSQGRDIAEEQAAYLLADELEMRRQLDQQAWLESFLEEHVKMLPPPDFLQAWNQHCLVREDLAQLGGVSQGRASIGLRVDGRLRVVAAPQGPPMPPGFGSGRGYGQLTDR
eukprot:TRINITY_DN50801_c0_g1_i1.p1 TRINITY_DN50801_c0_g1~~TRINITY_DN50801_c0_g1_i1.p1  ORF type:complete len:487 (-),score=110.12 TRINITY_DN50801_c0_g1_i1:13-1473(-)